MAEKPENDDGVGPDDIPRTVGLPPDDPEFSSDLVERAESLLAFDERRPISTLQRKLRMGHNTAVRLRDLISARRVEMSNDYKEVLRSALLFV